MIEGSDQERDCEHLRMKTEQASPGSGSGSDGTGCSEGMDYLQMYFGQSGYNRLLSSATDRPTHTADGHGDEPMQPSDQMELDAAELNSIFFGAEAEYHPDRTAVEGGELRLGNQPTEAPADGRPPTRAGASADWSSSQPQPAGWSWPNDPHPTAGNAEEGPSDSETAAALRPVGGTPTARHRLHLQRPSDATPERDSAAIAPTPTASASASAAALRHNFNTEYPNYYHPNNNNRSSSSSSNSSSSSTSLAATHPHPQPQPHLHPGGGHHQFVPPAALLFDSNAAAPHHCQPLPLHDRPPPLDPCCYPFNLYRQMCIPSLPAPKWPHSLSLAPSESQLNSSLPINPIGQLDPASADYLLAASVTEDDHNQRLIDLEFKHLVVEEQCAPSTPPTPSSFSNSHPARPSTSHRLFKHSLQSSTDSTLPFLSIDPLSSLFPAVDQGPPLYSSLPPASGFKELHHLDHTLGSLVDSSFDLYPSNAPSAPHQSLLSSSALPQPFSNPFLSDAPTSTRATPTIDTSIVSQLQPTPLHDLPLHHSFDSFESSVPLTSSLSSSSTLSHSTVPTPRSTPRCQLSNPLVLTRQIEPRNAADLQKDNHLLNRSQSQSALNKANAAPAEVPTAAELAIPRLERLNLSEPYPDDLELLLVGLQAQGAKTRVETQIKLTLVLITGQGGSIDRNGNLSTKAQHTLARIGNWSHIKLPAYSAIKRKSRKLIRTGIPPEETLFLDVAVVRASEPHEEIYCCSNCQVREQKRTQRKRDARVRPAQEIESDEAEQSIRPEDEKRKIVVFNCGQYVGFDSGELTLPTRITCYCRHHREKKGFRVKVSLRDHTHRLIATSTTPAIMITDDHKAVAAAAKAKSGSDAEDNQPRGRLIRRLPSTGSQIIASAQRRGKKKLPSASIGSPSGHQIGSGLTEDKGRYDFGTGWESYNQNCAGRMPSPSQSSSRSTSIKYKRKALNELNLRANIGRKTSTNQTAASAQISEHGDSFSSAENTVTDRNCQQMPFLECPCPRQESRPHSPTSAPNLSISMPSLATHLRATTPASSYLWQDYPPFPKQSWQEETISSRHDEINPVLALDFELKDLINTVQKFDPERMNTDHISSSDLPDLSGSNAEKSIDHSSSVAALHMAVMTDIGVGSQPCDLPSSGGQAPLTGQPLQNASRPALSCSTTSSPGQAVIYPCGTRVSTSPTSGSSATSPKSPIGYRQYHQFKCSNPPSRSSSIVCTQSRAGSDSSSHASELSRNLLTLPSQPDSPLDQLPGDPRDQPEPCSNPLDDVSRTCSPIDDTSIAMLDDVMANWSVVSSLLPPSSQTLDVRTSPKPLPTGISPRSRESANIQPVMNEETNSESTRTPDQLLPRLSKLVPNEGPIEGGIEITILGSNFHPGIKVDFGSGGVVRAQFWSSNTLICILPSSARSGPCEVSLVAEEEPERQQHESSGQMFTYVNQADQRLMQLALQVVGLKMTGQVQDPRTFARKIIIETKQFEGSLEDSLTHAADSVKGVDYVRHRIGFSDLKALDTLDDDGKIDDDD